MQEKGYRQDFIDKLKSACNIVSVVSKYVPLSRKGKTYWGCCPFHHEKTASFAVNEFEGYYHCFGCGVGGDVIKFVQSIEGIDFMQAVRNLAESVNMEVPEFTGDDNILARKKERDRLIYICTETAKYYHNELKKPTGQVARDYLVKRQITNETVTKLGLGYSSNWQGVIEHLKSLHISQEEMLKAGIISEKNGRVYDAMAERLVFPIFNHIGKVVGFSGRALSTDAFAKYKNTTETDIFKKSSLLFGLNNLRKARVDNKNYAILVEGQIDVVSLYQAGFPNAIATLGTAFNEHHIATISRFVDSIYICFDGDGAGRKATVRSVELLKDTNFDVKVVSLPEKLDPDEYIKKYGAESFENELKNAITVKEFQIEVLSEKFDLTDKNNIPKFVESGLNLVASFKNVTDRDIYLKKIAQIAKINEEILRRELNKKLIAIRNNQAQVAKPKISAIKAEENSLLSAETYVLACRLYKKEYATNIKSELFENASYKEFNQYLIDNNPIVSKVLDDYDVENNDYLKQIINYDFGKIKQEEQEYKGCLRKLEIRRLMKKQTELQNKLSLADDSQKYAILSELQSTIREIQAKKTEE